MKTIKYIMLFLLAGFLSLCLVSCRDNNTENPGEQPEEQPEENNKIDTTDKYIFKDNHIFT